MLVNRKEHGILGGDWNSIILKNDATRNPEAKMSSGLRRLVSAFELKDSHKLLHPRTKDYSRYYKNDKYGSGATRIDRIYIYGDINVSKSQYIPISWSDHLAIVSSYRLPDSLAKNSSVKSKPVFKISPNVIDDDDFQD